MSDNNESKRKLRTHTRDNVIFANFGNKTRVRGADSPSASPAGSESASGPASVETRDRGFSPAAQRLRQLVRENTDEGRVKRGRDYYRNKHVLNPRIGHGSISADVAGSQNLPFQVSITFPYRSTDQLAEVTKELAETTGGVALARAGNLSEAMLDNLLADTASDLRFRCDCPDHSHCCKHAVAVAYHAADMMGADPGLVFSLRGLNLVSLEHSVAMQARKISAERAKGSHEGFWNGADLPDLPEPKKAPALEDSDEMLLHKAMRMCSLTSVDELRAVADIEDMYDFLVNKK